MVCEMLGNGPHSGFATPAGMFFNVSSGTPIPFLDHAPFAPLVDDGDEARIPGGHELRSVIEGGQADATTGKTSPDGTAFVNDQHRAARGPQCSRSGQSRHTRAHDQNIGSRLEVLHGIASLVTAPPVCTGLLLLTDATR